jgi:hypothetical protein
MTAMKQRMILLTALAIGIGGIVSGCSAIGFVGGTVIDNTMTERQAVEMPTAEQIQDSSVNLPKGKTLVVETTSGGTYEGTYAGIRQIPVQLERQNLLSALASRYVRLYPDGAAQHQRPSVQFASRALTGSADRSGGSSEESIAEGNTVSVTADALLLLAKGGPEVVPLYSVKNISVVQPKESTMKLVILGAITDFVILQGVLGYLLTSS